jgi:hypothetical protein
LRTAGSPLALRGPLRGPLTVDLADPFPFLPLSALFRMSLSPNLPGSPRAPRE